MILNYVIGITSNALLPFAFACFVGRRDIWRAGAALLLLLLFYPITLSKLALFTPFWLVAMLVLSRYFNFKFAVTLSLLVPISVGLLLIILFQQEILPYSMTIPYFGLVNFRMIAIPSLAMDYYNSFFFTHPVTHFCQIRFLKPFVACPYQEQLAIVIYNAFGIGGQFNASLFATEGIASVGAFFAPVTALDVRARDSAWQSTFCWFTAAVHPDLGRRHYPGASQRAPVHSAAQPRLRHPVSSLVHHATRFIWCWQRASRRPKFVPIALGISRAGQPPGAAMAEPATFQRPALQLERVLAKSAAKAATRSS